MRFVLSVGIGVLALAAGAQAAPAEADQVAAMPFAVEAGIAPAQPLPPALFASVAPPPEAASGTFGQPIASGQLAAARGGTDSVSNEASLSGLVSGNGALNVSTGSNLVDGASFSNMAGIPIVIQNSGANVLIQNATIINLQLK